jgi:hypothetical protein
MAASVAVNLDQLVCVNTDPVQSAVPNVNLAVFSAGAELAFVAPEGRLLRLAAEHIDECGSFGGARNGGISGGELG